MSYKKTDKCITKAFDDEMLFVLMTRDRSAPQVVGEWIKQNIGIQPREKLIEALDCAIEMQANHSIMMERKAMIKNGAMKTEGITYCACLVNWGINPVDGNCEKCNGVIF